MLENYEMEKLQLSASLYEEEEEMIQTISKINPSLIEEYYKVLDKVEMSYQEYIENQKRDDIDIDDDIGIDL